MKEYNCPDCVDSIDTCNDCYRTQEVNSNIIIEHIPPYFPDSMVWPRDYDAIPNCCKHCSNHPINNSNASGVCNCSAPLYATQGN